MINKYGLKMNGLKAAARETGCTGSHSGDYVQIAYERSSGDVIARYHVSTSSWTAWHDCDVVEIINTQHKLTMQDIADAIAGRMDEIAREDEYLASL